MGLSFLTCWLLLYQVYVSIIISIMYNVSGIISYVLVECLVSIDVSYRLPVYTSVRTSTELVYIPSICIHSCTAVSVQRMHQLIVLRSVFAKLTSVFFFPCYNKIRPILQQ